MDDHYYTISTDTNSNFGDYLVENETTFSIQTPRVARKSKTSLLKPKWPKSRVADYSFPKITHMQLHIKDSAKSRMSALYYPTKLSLLADPLDWEPKTSRRASLSIFDFLPSSPTWKQEIHKSTEVIDKELNEKQKLVKYLEDKLKEETEINADLLQKFAQISMLKLL